MTVSGPTSSALGALTSSGTLPVQQRIAAKVVMDQMESEAAMVAQLVQAGNAPADSTGVGTRVDAKA